MNTSKQKSQSFQFLGNILILWLLGGCGANQNQGEDPATEEVNTTTTSTSTTTSPSAGTTTTSVVLDDPKNTTGRTASTVLSFTTNDLANQALVATSGVDIDVNTTITTAKFSLGSIKVKVNKTESSEESALKKEMETKKKEMKEAQKEQEKTLEKREEEAKKKFEAKKDEAKDEAEKAALEKTWESSQQSIEAEIAALFKSFESSLDDDEALHDPNLKWKGPYVYDALTQKVSPAIPATSITDGGYQRIELKLKPNRSETGTNSMMNLSALIIGTYKSTPLEIRYEKDEEYKLMGSGELQLAADISNNIKISFDMKAAFAGIDLSKAKVDEVSKKILLDKEHNSDILEKIFKNLKKSVGFGKDRDGDGKLGKDEKEGDGVESSTP